MFDWSICKTPSVGQGRVLALSLLQHLWSKVQPRGIAAQCGCLLSHEPVLAQGAVIYETLLTQDVASHDPLLGVLALNPLLCMVKASAITGRP